jgi:hypothetical protein
VNARDIAQVAHQAGFRGRKLETAVAVALAESGGDPGINAVGAEDSRGLWQINSVHFGSYDEQRLYQPGYNARAAFDISDGGRDWQPWTTWREGTHGQYLDDARRAVDARPWRDDDGGRRDGDRETSDGDGRNRGDRGSRGDSDQRGGDPSAGGRRPGRDGEGDRHGHAGGRRRDGRRARRRAELAPWRVPRDGAGRTGRVVVTPSFMDDLARVLTGHLATADEVDRGARHRVAELDVDKLVVADGLDGFVKRTAHAAVEEHKGTRRLPNLFTRDVGYVVEARRRAVDMDAAKAFGPKAIDVLVASLAGTTSRRTRNRVRGLLKQLGPDRLPTTPRRHGDRRDSHGGNRHGGDRPGDQGGGNDRSRDRDHAGGRRPADVDLDRRWGGTESVFEQLVTPLMRERGLQPGSAKRGVIPGSSTSSDHYVGNETAYAVDYPTTRGADDARALARRLGIDDWRPDSYQSFHVRIGGQRFRLQILWGAAIDHADHVHVGLRRA